MLRIGLFFVALFSSSQASIAQAEFGYDLTSSYENLKQSLSRDCSLSINVFKLYRPVAPLVQHVFVAAEIRQDCDGRREFETYLFGAPKTSDFAYWQTGKRKRVSEFQFTLHDGDARFFLLRAMEISERWQRKLQQNTYFYPRMLMTPLMGRICLIAANEVLSTGLSPLAKE